MKKIVILHVFPDDKFFDMASDVYNSLPDVENRYYFYKSDNNYIFRYIKKIERIKVFRRFTLYVKELRRRDVDIVFFHSMLRRNYLYTLFLRRGTKIVWWGWGYDLYENRGCLQPIIKLDLYKLRTKELIEKSKKDGIRFNSNFIVAKVKAAFFTLLRRIALSRVSLFMPCIPVEYDLLKQQCHYFHAKLAINPFFVPLQNENWFEKAGNVLVGNSLTYTNNHLDVFEYLYKIDLGVDRKYIIPVSYGKDYVNADSLIKESHFEGNTVIWLRDYISFNEYKALLNSVTHAIFGVIRQQALGNIFSCLVNGVKVFLYKDSVVAQQLRSDGYIFYTIEDDLNAYSISRCLSKEEALHNYKNYARLQNGRGVENVRKQLEEIIHNCYIEAE